MASTALAIGPRQMLGMVESHFPGGGLEGNLRGQSAIG